LDQIVKHVFGIRHPCKDIPALGTIHNFQFLLTRLSAHLLLLLFTSCSSLPTPTAAPIDSLHLLVTSVALDLDQLPGPDGVGVRVYASRKDSNEALPITSGTLEILMFDGSLAADELSSVEPLKKWSYPAETLRKYVQKTSIGTSYRFAALWGDAKPKDARVTVVTRYIAPDGRQIYSAPGSVPVSLK
jgi:hypothetical protein